MNEPGRGGNGVLEVSDAEKVGDTNAKREGYVEQKTPHHTFRNNDTGVLDFFRYLESQ